MTEPAMSVVTFLWKPAPTYRSQFKPEHVNILRNMTWRNFAVPHRFIVVTDFPASAFDKRIEVIPLWKDFAELRNPFGPTNPSCYRRLKVFSREAAAMFGPRFVCLDLDVVIVGDMRPLWLRREDFIIWGDTNPTTAYNGSMILMTAGAREKVWTDFDPAMSPIMTRRNGLFGSDQAWIAYVLGPNEIRWTNRDGIYSYRNEIGPHKKELPLNARIIVLHGQKDPWSPDLQGLSWIKQHYR